MRSVVALLVGTMLLGACRTPSPVLESPLPSATDAAVLPTGVPAPTRTATPTPILGAWTNTNPLPDGFRMFDAVHGDEGWLALGSCGPPQCDDARASWFSPDGSRWTPGTLPEDGEIESLAWNGTYWAAGSRTRSTSGEGHSFAVVWRSEDGSAWEETAEIDLGACIEGCPAIGEIVAGTDGLVIEWADFLDNRRTGPYRSADGRSWERIDPRALGISGGLSTFAIDGVAVGSEIVLGVTPSEGDTTVWASTDGAEWASIGTLPLNGESPETVISTANSTLVVAVERCAADGCSTLVWTSAARGSWAATPLEFDMVHARIASTDDHFVLAGLTPAGAPTFVSSDGLEWRPGSTLPWGECGIHDLSSGDGRVYLFGDRDCEITWSTPAF